MLPSEVFTQHAAECESMAKFSRDPEDKEVWRRMAERWMRCALHWPDKTHRHKVAARQNCIGSPHSRHQL